MSAPTPTEFVATTRAARHLGITEKTLRLWTDRGLIRVFRTPGGQRRYSVDDLDAFLADHTTGGETAEASA